MSAICGVIRLDGQAVALSELETMVESSPYRGPDGTAYHIHENAGFAHLAFHLTPESVHEKQPLTSEEGRLVLVADVRLDNRDELFSKLELRKDTDRVITDPQLIMLAYHKWGKACVEHFLGDFVFSIWDSKAKSLFLARDPLGAYSVSYHQAGKRFVFASEIAAILDLPYVQPVINEERVLREIEYLPRSHEETFFDSIYYLAPAHCMEVTTSGTRTWRYWDINPAIRISYNSDEEYANHLLELVDQATACRLRSSGSVGIALSGGNDSTLLAASAAKQMASADQPQSQLMSFSYVFDKLKKCDEREYIEPVVEQYGLDAHYIQGDELWTFRYLEKQPIAKDYLWTNCFVNLPLSIASAAQQAGCRLLLNGHVGDAVFSGPTMIVADLLRKGQLGSLFTYLKRYSHDLNWRQDVLLQGLGPLSPGWAQSLYRRTRNRRKDTFIGGLTKNQKQNTKRIRNFPAEKSYPGKLTAGTRRRYNSLFNAAWSQDFAASRSLCYNRFGVEPTSPYYDRRIVEFVLSIPAERISQPGKPRLLQTNAMKKVLPRAVCERKHKTLFNTLLNKGLFDKEQSKVQSLLNNPLVVQQEWVSLKWLEEQAAPGGTRSEFGYPLSNCLHLELWLRGIKQQAENDQRWSESQPPLI